MSVDLVILFFGKAKEIVGKSRETLTVRESVSYDYLLSKIVEEFSLQPIRNNIILAHNEEFCDLSSEVVLKQGDEIAVVPPLSGG